MRKATNWNDFAHRFPAVALDQMIKDLFQFYAVKGVIWLGFGHFILVFLNENLKVQRSKGSKWNIETTEISVNYSKKVKRTFLLYQVI